MSRGIDLTDLYHLRTDFTILAITGRTGSGCSTVADQLCKGFSEDEYPDPKIFKKNPIHNSFRKYEIVYKYAKKNFSPFEIIRYRDTITYFILKHDFQNLIDYIHKTNFYTYNRDKSLLNFDFKSEIQNLKAMSDRCVSLQQEVEVIEKLRKDAGQDYKEKLYSFFYGKPFVSFSRDFHDEISRIQILKRNILLRSIANNLRRSGNPFVDESNGAKNIFTVVELINDIIKAVRKKNGNNKTKVVIDSLRNPLEVMFFRQRFSAFYLISVNRINDERVKNVEELYGTNYETVEGFFEEEYKGGKGNEFYSQYVRECIEKADIHVNYIKDGEVESLNRNKEKGDQTSPFFSWKMQLLKYVTLIDQPGIITPTPEERCMQIAYTAKYNSGCISRQVGAAVTDSYYSVKSIGWNNTPEGQVPCNLRNVEALLTYHDGGESVKDSPQHPEQEADLAPFTPYEKDESVFRETLKKNFKEQISKNGDKLRGRSVCFCFKSLKNSFSEGKNQVHTRSLHAEESAFLQISKYGGQGIYGGKLFTTASPCELCSKKAYQLGIKVIYYIDPYPGISESQILNTGYRKPEVRLFNGAIGAAYHWLYEPLMAYKDELSLLLGQNITDLAAEQQNRIREQNEKIELLKREIEELRAKE